MMFDLIIYNYANARIDTPIWTNFSNSLLKVHVTAVYSSPDYWKQLADPVLKEYDAVMIAGEGRIQFATAEQRMAFIMNYS